MENVIIILILAVILAVAVSYIRIAKKRGQKCIGCPYSRKCGTGCSLCKNKTGNSHQD